MRPTTVQLAFVFPRSQAFETNTSEKDSPIIFRRVSVWMLLAMLHSTERKLIGR